MARHAVLFALLLAACILEVTYAGAAKGGRNKNGDNFPEPVRRAKPCPIKSPECVPTYTESDAKRLAELGYLGQVAVEPDMPLGLLRDLMQQDKPKHKRKASCRGEEGAECRRPQRKRGGEGRKGGAGRAGEARKGRKGSRKKASRGEEDPTKTQRPHDQQTRKERNKQRRKRPTTPAPAQGAAPQ